MDVTLATNRNIPDLSTYDVILLAFSGGKDSLACLLYLLFVLKVPAEKIELHHHDIDGREGSTLMDWRSTRDYCVKIAAAFGVKLFFSWKIGGFEREMLRHDAPTAGYAYETPEGIRYSGGASKNRSTREVFPLPIGDLSRRWCSAYLKIMVMDALIRGQERFLNKRVLVITGERAEESPNRAKYATFEPHRSDLREGRTPRHVDHWRPVHAWSEAEVWAIIKFYAVNVHPAYFLGWNRVSCAACIFGDSNQWASLRAVNLAQFNAVAAYEVKFGKSVKIPLIVKKSGKHLTVISTWADDGHAYPNMLEVDLRAALSETFDQPVILEDWTLPAGAFGDGGGPT